MGGSRGMCQLSEVLAIVVQEIQAVVQEEEMKS